MRSIPYPSIGSHGLIGDRRTAAMIAADGSLDWLCLPSYDAQILCGGLLDSDRGGLWRMGPARAGLGEQHYVRDSFVLVTTWTTRAYQLELTDVMPWPDGDRPEDLRHVHAVIRRLRCVRGEVRCTCDLSLALDFQPLDSLSAPSLARPLWLWASRPLDRAGAGAHGTFVLHRDDEMWAVLASAPEEPTWTIGKLEALVDETTQYWSRWSRHVAYTGPRARQLKRSCTTIHLLDNAVTGSLVAAPTTSLPEQIGGGWNADYRYTWVRDASIALAITSRFTGTREAKRYLDWLSHLGSSTDSPLQVLYRIDGGLEAEQREVPELHGYRGSQPVRYGNHAYKQVQHGAVGFLTDCVKVFLESGGTWEPTYWDLVRRVADSELGAWREPDNGIWELSCKQHYIASAVMSWVALERATWIAERVGQPEAIPRWRAAMDEIHDFVMTEGWSPRLRAFRQRTEAHNLDSAALLIPIMELLPADHPRVSATVDRIMEQLTIDHFVFRFDPEEVPGVSHLPMGEFEGAFLPCTFWLATVLARAGRPDEAEDILEAVERASGPLGLYAEGIDVRTHEPLGNAPLAFSHGEHVRAIEEVAKAHVVSRARMLFGRAEQRIRKALQPMEQELNRRPP